MLLFTVVNFSAVKGRGQGILKSEGLRLEVWILTAGSVRNVLCHGRALWEQRLVSWGGLVRNALCHGGGPVRNASCLGGGSVRNALCHGGGPVAQRVVSRRRVCAQRVVSWGRACCATRCVTGARLRTPGGPCAQRFVSWGGVCVTPCVTGSWVDLSLCSPEEIWQGLEGQRFIQVATGSIAKMRPLRGGRRVSAMCHAGARNALSAQRFVSWGRVCAQSVVSRGRVCAQRVRCVTEGRACAQGLFWGEPFVTEGRPVHNALCHRGGAGAQRLVSLRGHRGGFLHSALCHRAGAALPTTPCVTRGALCTTPCVTARPGSQRLVSPGGPVRNALCHSGACACGLVVRATNFFPASHGLKSQARSCAQRLVSLQGGGAVHNALCHRGCLRTTPCVIGGGGPVHNALCHRGGTCAQRVVSRNALCRRGGAWLDHSCRAANDS